MTQLANIGYASLQIIPSMKGVKQALTSQVTGPASSAGKAGGSAMGKAMKVGLMAGGAAAAAAGAALFKVGETFDQVSDTIRIGTGATGEALRSMEKSAKAVGRTTPAAFEDIGTAIADVNTRLGLTGKPLERRTKQFLELSRITGTDVTSNIKTVTRAFGDWEVKTKDQAGTMDLFFRAAQSSGASVDELAKQVVQFGAPLRQVGFSLEESTAMFANFEKAGVNTSTMMPGLKMAMKTFFEKGIDPKKGLTAAFKGIQDGSIGASEAIKIFGSRAGGDMIEAVKQGRFNLDEMTEALVDGSDTIMKAGKETMDFAESWQILKNRGMAAVEPLATRLFQALSQGMDWMSTNGIPTLRRFGEFMARNAKPIKMIAAVIGAVLVPALARSIAMHIKAAAVSVAKWVWMGAMSLVNAAKMAAAWVIAMGPVGWVIAAIVGLVVVVVKNWDTIKRVIAAGWEWVRNATKVAWDAIVGFLKTLWGMTLPGLIFNNLDKIKAGIKSGIDGIVGFFRAMPGRLLGALGNLKDTLVTAGADLISGLIRGATDWIKKIPGMIGDAVKGIGSAVLRGLSALNPFGDGEGIVPGGATGSAGGIARSAIAKFGGSITSSYRPGSTTASGNVSYHSDSKNPAHDFAGPNMLGAARWIAATFGSGLRELIHTPLGFGIKHGRKVPLSYFSDTVNKMHYNHVHVADKGGIFKGPGYVWMGAGQETFASGLAAEKVAPLPKSREGIVINQEFHDKADPLHVAAEISWALA